MKKLILILMILLTSCETTVTENIVDDTLDVDVRGNNITIKRVEYKDAICFVAVGHYKAGLSCILKGSK